MPPDSDRSGAMSLPQLQRAMMASIVGVSVAELPSFVRLRNDLTPKALLSIYRHDIQAVLLNALRISYPIVEQLVGIDFFRMAAQMYVVETPSHSGDLETYGDEFGEFIERFPPASTLPYLADVARFERLLALLRGAPQTPALNLKQLADISADTQKSVRLTLVPRAALFRSRYPVLQIWQMHQSADGDVHLIDFTAGDDRLLVIAGELTAISQLSEAEYRFYAAAEAQLTLQEAVKISLSVDSQLSLADVLRRAISAEALCRRADSS